MAAESTLDAGAFKRIYPHEFYSKFIADGVRPDARPLGGCRDTNLGAGTVGSADGSALAKVGPTTVLAGVKLEVCTPGGEGKDEGQLVVSVEMPPLCSPDVRPGRPPEAAHTLQVQVSNALESAGCVDLKQLCIQKGGAAWVAYLDIYVLEAAGSVLDAALLAAAGALRALRLPAVEVGEGGRVVEKEMADAEGRGLDLGAVPLSLTCGLYKGKVISDPSADEEPLMEALVSVVLGGEEGEQLMALHKPGGAAEAGAVVLQQCVETARIRYKQLRAILG